MNPKVNQSSVMGQRGGVGLRSDLGTGGERKMVLLGREVGRDALSLYVLL